MAILRAKRRNALPKSDFGLPGSRKYPMPDKEHAGVAKAYASKEANAGKLSGSAKAQIDRKADRVLGEKGGRSGARDGLGNGRGGMASHPNMASMHSDRTMRHERY